MTTHVFIVDHNTFKYHLNYQFVGTGKKDNYIDFNNSGNSKLHHLTENTLIGMMADGCRLRKDDLIIFYCETYNGLEGRFFGIFKAKEDGIFIDNNDSSQYLREELGRSLLFRATIEPYEVWSEGVTEWQALDEIKRIASPNQMLWSLIYRKLKAGRGNTMITMYESERLINLIRQINMNNTKLELKSNEYYDFDDINCKICIKNGQYIYEGKRKEKVNILPRLIEKYNKGQAYEAHLQMYITQNIGISNTSLNEALNITGRTIEWIGNEIICSVGFRRIDIGCSIFIDKTKRIFMPIELKAVPVSLGNTEQLNKYIDWIEQYYIPNNISIIQPVLICKKDTPISQKVIDNFNDFNLLNTGKTLKLKYIEHFVSNNQLIFEEVGY